MRNHAERIIIVLCLLCSIVAAIMAVRVYFSIIPPEEPEIVGESHAGYVMKMGGHQFFAEQGAGS